MFRPNRWPRLVRVLSVALVAALLVPVGTAVACPFCDAPSVTLAETVHEADVVLLVEWPRGTEPGGETTGGTDYAVVRALENGTRSFEKGDTVALDRFRPGEKGELALLTAFEGTSLEWSRPIPVDETIVRYVENAPSPERPTAERLVYYVNFLEHADQAIASDAYAEFANAHYDDITRVRESLPRERLRKWIESDETPPNRIGLYGLLLGLCGNADDARFLRDEILEPTTELRLGIEGVMSGYVLLAGETGLAVIEESKFAADAGTVPVSETFAGMKALQFLQLYEKEVIPAERLNRSMRLLLDRPDVAENAITDLARWKDWSVVDRLVRLYGTKGYEVGTTKRAIIGYLTAAIRDVPTEPGTEPGPHVAKATAALETLRERDRETVEQTLNFQRLLMGP